MLLVDINVLMLSLRLLFFELKKTTTFLLCSGLFLLAIIRDWKEILMTIITEGKRQLSIYLLLEHVWKYATESQTLFKKMLLNQ